MSSVPQGQASKVAPPQKKVTPMHLLTGSISGAISRTVTNPLERLKMLKQVSTVVEYRDLSMWRSFVYMYQNEGVYGFFKGNGVNVVRIAPFTAFEFFFYEFYKEKIFSGESTSAFNKLMCGGLTGMTASTLTYPLDLIRTLLSIDVGAKGQGNIIKNPTIIGTGRQVVREQGFFGLYRGLCSTLFGITPYVAFKMATFDILKTFFVIDRNHPQAQIYNLTMGGVAGIVSVTLTYPTDLIRRRMQLIGMEGQVQYKNMFDCGAQIYKVEGVQGLFKGLVPCYAKVVPAMAIMFWCNENLKKLLQVN